MRYIFILNILEQTDTYPFGQAYTHDLFIGVS